MTLHAHAHPHPDCASARTAASAVLAGALLLCSGMAKAAGLEVSPTFLQIEAAENAQSLTLRNTGPGTAYIQVRAFAWEQQEMHDRFLPAKGITISPPMVQLEANGRQVIRVIRTTSTQDTETSREKAYRLIIDELPILPTAEPEASGMGVTTTAATTATTTPAARHAELSFMLRYSVPVFVMPRHAAAHESTDTPVLHWELDRSTHPWLLTVRNTGTTRAQLSSLRAWIAPEKSEPVFNGLIGYVLAGQTMQWKLTRTSAVRNATRFSATVNRSVQDFHAPLP